MVATNLVDDIPVTGTVGGVVVTRRAAIRTVANNAGPDQLVGVARALEGIEVPGDVFRRGNATAVATKGTASAVPEIGLVADDNERQEGVFAIKSLIRSTGDDEE